MGVEACLVRQSRWKDGYTTRREPCRIVPSCESEIENPLLGALYPRLSPDAQKELQAQHIIDYYDTPFTIPDFAFPDVKIAIYCDSYEHHRERDSFQKDRQQAREREDQEKRLRMRMLRQTLPIGGAFAAGLVAAGLVAAVVLMILVESFFLTLFYHLTSGF